MHFFGCTRETDRKQPEPDVSNEEKSSDSNYSISSFDEQADDSNITKISSNTPEEKIETKLNIRDKSDDNVNRETGEKILVEKKKKKNPASMKLKKILLPDSNITKSLDSKTNDSNRSNTNKNKDANQSKIRLENPKAKTQSPVEIENMPAIDSLISKTNESKKEIKKSPNPPQPLSLIEPQSPSSTNSSVKSTKTGGFQSSRKTFYQIHGSYRLHRGLPSPE